MPGAQQLDEREDYLVRVVEFASDTDSAIGALQRVFGLSEADARAMVREAPVVVRRGINRIRADYFRRALQLTGARVEVELEGAPDDAPGPPPTAAEPSADPAPAERERSAASPFAKTLLLGATDAARAVDVPLGARPANDVAPGDARAAPVYGDLDRGPEPRAAAAPAAATAAGPAPAPAAAGPPVSRATQVLGSSPGPGAAGGWGDLRSVKPAGTGATAAKAPSPPRASHANPFEAGGPRELDASDMSGGLELDRTGAHPRDTAATAGAHGTPGSRELGARGPGRRTSGELGADGPGRPGPDAGDPSRGLALNTTAAVPRRSTANAGGAGKRGPVELSAEGAGGLELDTSGAHPRESTANAGGAGKRGPVELSTSDMPPSPPLELGVEEPGLPPFHSPAARGTQPRDRESAGRYDAIPSGEKWKAPGTDTLARARRKQSAKDAQSGLADDRPSPMPPGKPAPGQARQAGRIADRTPARPIATQRATPARHPASAGASLAWRGGALAWTGWIVLASLGAGAAAELGSGLPVLGLPVLALAMIMLLALCGTYHRRVLWAAATGEAQLPSARARASELMRTGLPLTAFAALSQALLWTFVVSQLASGKAGIAIVTAPAFWVLGIGPAVYWPVALGCAAATNQARRVWDVARGLRALGRAPAAVGRIVLGGSLALAVPLAILTALFGTLGLSGPFGLIAASGAPLALSHALMGVWTGELLREQPQVFE